MNNACNLENLMLFREDHFKNVINLFFHVIEKMLSIFPLFTASYKTWEMGLLNQLIVA